MGEKVITAEEWKDYLGIEEEKKETVPADDVEGEWEDARKF